MSLKSGQLILMDTNAIIEAHRTGFWKALVSHFLLETVSKCVEECGTGSHRRKDFVKIDVSILSTQLQVKKVPPETIVQVSLKLSHLFDVDPGERELLAYSATLKRDWKICSPDKGALQAGSVLKILDHFVSLEEMIQATGQKVMLRENYTSRWLSQKRTELLIENE